MRSVLAIVAFFMSSTTLAASVDFDIEVPYRAVAAFYRSGFDRALDPFVRTTKCSEVGTVLDLRPPGKQYRCGEIPFGRIIEDTNLKRILNIEIPRIAKKDGSVSYKMNATNLKLDLVRSQFEGEIEILSLDTLARSQVPVAKRFGESNYIALNPRDGNLSVPFCVGIPGLKVKSEVVKVDGDLHKEIFFWPDLNADLDIRVHLGRADFAVGKICGEIQTEFTDGGAPVFKVTEVGLLQLSDLDSQGLRVKVDADVGGIYGFLNEITKVFGFDIEKIVEREVKAAVLASAQEQIDITLTKIRNGRWFKDYVDKAGLNKIAKRISSELAKKLNEVTGGERVEDFILRQSCRTAADSGQIPDPLRQAFYDRCVGEVKVDILYYQNNVSFRGAGCYGHKFDPKKVNAVDGNPKWWSEGCALTHTVRLTGPTDLIGFFN